MPLQVQAYSSAVLLRAGKTSRWYIRRANPTRKIATKRARTLSRGFMNALLVILAWAGSLPDRGIFPELLARVNLEAPRAVDPARGWLRVDRAHRLVTLYDGDDPVTMWPLGSGDV